MDVHTDWRTDVPTGCSSESTASDERGDGGRLHRLDGAVPPEPERILPVRYLARHTDR